MSLYALVAGVIAICATFALLIRLRIAQQDANVDLAAWLEVFSLDAYAPLDSLLDDERDFAFLVAQPGYRPAIARELRREHRAIAREYLHSLTADFRRLVQIAKLMALYAKQDRSLQAVSIWRAEVNFYSALAITHLSLAGYPLAKRWASHRALGQLASLYRGVHPDNAAI